MTTRKTWIAVVLFAAAMAWMESATVVYVRTLVGRLEPYQAEPLPLVGNLYWVELVREAATMVMLGSAGFLAGRERRTRIAYFLIAFGVWDILYYVFLAVIGPWPRSILAWDILFLIPLPWWGPVLAPVSIAALMVLGGTLVTQAAGPDSTPWPGPRSWLLCGIGCVLALVAFMWDALQVVGGGPEALVNTLPTWFNWPLFLPALALMSAPVAALGRKATMGV